MDTLLMTRMFLSLVQPLTSSLINVITIKGIRKAGIRQEGGFLPLSVLPLIMKALGKGIMRAGRRYNTMDQIEKN